MKFVTSLTRLLRAAMQTELRDMAATRMKPVLSAR